MENLDISRGCAREYAKRPFACVFSGTNKLNVYNWLKDTPSNALTPDIVEIRFKNTRKAFFKNINKLQLVEGDIVAVEATPGHDMGIVSLTGELVWEQMKKQGISPKSELKNVYRKAKPVDLEKWESSIQRENAVMLRARKIANLLNLNMKIGDVEFQGDGTKAIFYYIADERVDFRQLIKDLADEFRIRIEMRQIGARQEAGRIGGIGSCGRTLCCSSWMTDFVSVTTNAARYQEISLNPQKLAGQCGKLKCCLNFEVDCYRDAQKGFPPKVPLQTEEGTYYCFKTDVHRRMIWYSARENEPMNITPVSVERATLIYEMNKKGKTPQKLNDAEVQTSTSEKTPDFQNVVGQESITRFQNNDKGKKKFKKNQNDKNIQNRQIIKNNQNGNEQNNVQNKTKPEIKPENKQETSNIQVETDKQNSNIDRKPVLKKKNEIDNSKDNTNENQ